MVVCGCVAEGPFVMRVLSRYRVNGMSQVLRKYSDKTMARSLVEELESFGADLDPPLPSSPSYRSVCSDLSLMTPRFRHLIQTFAFVLLRLYRF
jgi:hypothetical protein